MFACLGHQRQTPGGGRAQAKPLEKQQVQGADADLKRADIAWPVGRRRGNAKGP
jgi:hypothetical protein